MAKIQFLNLQVTDVTLKANTYDQGSTEEIKSGPFKINVHAGNPEEKAFGISFQIELTNKAENFNLKVKAIAHFMTDSDITDDFMNSDFVLISAPAIAFPFLRTFISNITLNSGYNPIVLPAFNFVAMAKHLKEKIAKEVLDDKKRIKKVKKI